MRDRSQKVCLIFGDNALITPKAESLGELNASSAAELFILIDGSDDSWK